MIFFDVDHFLKVFIEFVIILLLFWFFGYQACRISAPWPVIGTTPSALEGEGLNTGVLGKAQHYLSLTSCMHQILMGYFLEEHNPFIEEV